MKRFKDDTCEEVFESLAQEEYMRKFISPSDSNSPSVLGKETADYWVRALSECIW